MGPHNRRNGSRILRPKARIIGVIGSELISNDNVALLELVKNSYDADAKAVVIRFDGPMAQGNGRIVVADNGIGMSLETVLGGWMEPASSTKSAKRESPSGRMMLGEKGIGRFAAAKIAKTLTMITKDKEEPEIEAKFDWSYYEDGNKYLDEIKNEWEQREPRLIKENGTVLIMEPVNEEWKVNKVKSLKLALSRLIDPLSPIPDFKITIEMRNTTKELEELSGEVAPPASLGKPKYKLEGKVESDGRATFRYTGINSKTKTLSDDLYSPKSNNDVTCGEFSYEFRVWDRDDLRQLAEDLGITLRDIQRDLNDASGISVYRDKFRVLPYGESARKNDWLGLDIRRVQNPTMRLSNNQIVGQISISLSKNPKLRDQSNREGIVHTPEYEDLVGKVVWILSKLEAERYREKRANPKTTSEATGIFNLIDLRPVIELVNTKLSEDEEAKKIVLNAESQIKQGIKKAQEVISRYHRLSTLGLLVDTILHDGNNNLLRIDGHTRLIEKELGKPNPDAEKVKKYLNMVNTEKKLLEGRIMSPFCSKRGPSTPGTSYQIFHSSCTLYIPFFLQEGRLGQVRHSQL